MFLTLGNKQQNTCKRYATTKAALSYHEKVVLPVLYKGSVMCYPILKKWYRNQEHA